MSDYLELLPAVDITEGRAVQLAQGVAGSERVYGDPVAAAMRWQDAGAEWLHLVDLDAAFGRGTNRELQAEIVGALDIKVEMSGGIRDDESLAAALAGLSRATSAPPRWSSPSGAPGSSPSTETGSRSASTSAAPRSRPAAGPRGRRPLRDARPPRRRGLCPLRRHRRQQGRHAPGAQPAAAPRRLRRHRRAGRRLGWRHHPRRHRGADGPGRRRGRGRDRRHRALRGPVHARGRARTHEISRSITEGK